jgi:hypothetical protein
VTTTDDFLEEKKKGRAKESLENRVFLLRRGGLKSEDEEKTSRSFGNKKKPSFRTEVIDVQYYHKRCLYLPCDCLSLM